MKHMHIYHIKYMYNISLYMYVNNTIKFFFFFLFDLSEILKGIQRMFLA